MDKMLVGLIVLLVVGVGAFVLFSNSTPSITGITLSNAESGNGIKSFYITGENFKFVMNGENNPDIRVKSGDIVRIEFSSSQGLHDWVLDEFNAATDQVRDTDDSTFVEFVANQKGIFEYYCSVGQHRANGMKGIFIVE